MSTDWEKAIKHRLIKSHDLGRPDALLEDTAIEFLEEAERLGWNAALEAAANQCSAKCNEGCEARIDALKKEAK